MIAADDGRTVRQLRASGVGAGGVAPDGRLMLAWEQVANGTWVVKLLDLKDLSLATRTVNLPRGFVHDAIWAADRSLVYVYLLPQGGGSDANGSYGALIVKHARPSHSRQAFAAMRSPGR